MYRCLELARFGAGQVAPNPMVGAVLVYRDRIIGEGYHQQYGQAHAEVNCINNVAAVDKGLIERSTLYVSLEPCAHHGKTPPCADLIIAHRIPEVVIACRDSYAEVNGRGIEKLKAAGVKVIPGILEKEALELNRRFFTFHMQRRPYIILKWAQSSNGQIANSDRSRVRISNDQTNILVHRWRSEEASILVGTHTALHDNPALTARLWKGNHPVRLVVDRHLQLPAALQVLDGMVRTIIFNYHRQEEKGNLLYFQLKETEDTLAQLLHALYDLRLQSVLVEGGAALLQSFIDKGYWDEARVITNSALMIPNGLNAPVLREGTWLCEERVLADRIACYRKK